MNDPIKIAIIADSLALPRPLEAGLVRYEETYPVLLSKMLCSIFPDRDILIAERGERFRTIGSVFQDWTEIVDYRKPQFVIVQVGIVDCAPRVFSESQRRWLERLRPALLRRGLLSIVRRFRSLLISFRRQQVYTDLQQFELHYRAVIERSHRSGVAQLIAVNILQPTDELEARSKGFSANSVAYNAVLQRVCRELGATLLDYNGLLGRAGGVGALTVDGMHPSAAGHILLAQALCEKIAEKITQRRAAC